VEGTALMNANTRNTIKLIVGTVGFFGMLVAIQLVVSAYNSRMDLTPQKKYTLSPRTERVISQLTQDVHLTAFINSDRPENFFVDDLLARMASLSPHFQYAIVDINRNPALARQYDANQYGTLVFEGNRQKSTLLSAGETAMISAILQVTRAKGEKIVYFLTGHGEGDIKNSDTNDGYSKIRGALSDEFYTDKIFSLVETGAVPQDATVVVLLGPKQEFTPAEISALDAYVQDGGALLVLLDPEAPASLIAFLGQYGFNLPPLVAVDPGKRLYAGEILTFRVSATANPHRMITSVNAPPIFSGARMVEVRPDEAKGISVQPILATSGDGWATAPDNITSDGQVQRVLERDVPGPVPIAGEAVLQKGEKHGRIVVFGDSDLTTNFLIDHGGNRDLFVNAINWLAEDIGQIGARPYSKTPGTEQFFLGADQGRIVAIISAVILPGFFLLVGISVFLWRRRG
jgi:hypothetical protein